MFSEDSLSSMSSKQTIGYSTLLIYGAGFVGDLVGGYLADWWRSKGASPNLVLRTMLGSAGAFVVGTAPSPPHRRRRRTAGSRKACRTSGLAEA